MLLKKVSNNFSNINNNNYYYSPLISIIILVESLKNAPAAPFDNI